jgi:hypothetical protein
MSLSFSQQQLKHIRRIKKSFDKLYLNENQEVTCFLEVGVVNDDHQGDPVAFNQLFIVSGDGKERVLLTEDMVFTPETEQQHIFDIVKECLEEDQADENAT